jgi:uncharacterized damage-inducible protein DinB
MARPAMAASLSSHFQLLARYNSAVNERVYAACAEITEEEYRRERTGSFASIHRLLNHILLADRIWMARFSDSEMKGTPPLDTILFEHLVELRKARLAQDRSIENFMDTLDESFFNREFRYVNNAGLLCLDPAPLVLAHFFNHQTHHRGQIHVMLASAGVKGLALDLHRTLKAPL